MIEGRKKNSKSLASNNRVYKAARARLNKMKGGGLFGAIGGIARGVGGAAVGATRAVGGAAVGGVKAAGGAAKYVAAGTLHHASQAARAVAPHVRVGINVNLSRKARPKIPNTKVGNNKSRYSESSHLGLGWNKQYVQHVRNSGNII
jgi:hypothetical protein